MFSFSVSKGDNRANQFRTIFGILSCKKTNISCQTKIFGIFWTYEIYKGYGRLQGLQKVEVVVRLVGLLAVRLVDVVVRLVGITVDCKTYTTRVTVD